MLSKIVRSICFTLRSNIVHEIARSSHNLNNILLREVGRVSRNKKSCIEYFYLFSYYDFFTYTPHPPPLPPLQCHSR